MLFAIIAASLAVLALVLWIVLRVIAVKTYQTVAVRPQSKGVIKEDKKNLSNRPEEYEVFVKDAMTRLKEFRFEGVSINSFDGIRLQGYYFPSDKPSKKLIICVHGYTSYAFRGFAAIVPFLHSSGMDVLLVDNRAHGESEGVYCGFGVLDRKDVLCWVDYAAGRKGDDCEIYLYGVSMGGATVLMTSGLDLPSQVKGIVADCPFSNFWEQMNHTIKASSGLNGALIVNMVSNVSKKKAGFGFKDVDAGEEIKKCKVPVLFIHGTRDDFVPLSNTEKIAANCPTHVEKLVVEGAGHGMCYYMSPRDYENRMTDLFRQADESLDD